jgi:hypothetical protein
VFVAGRCLGSLRKGERQRRIAARHQLQVRRQQRMVCQNSNLSYRGFDAPLSPITVDSIGPCRPTSMVDTRLSHIQRICRS